MQKDIDCTKNHSVVLDRIHQFCASYGAKPIPGHVFIHDMKKLSNKNEHAVEALQSIWSFPEDNFGPFRDLSEPMQKALSESVLFYIQEQYFLTSFVLKFFGYGPLSWVGTACIRLGWRLKSKWGKASRLTTVGMFFVRQSKLAGKGYLKAFRFTRICKRPFLVNMWHYISIDPLRVMHDYVEKVPNDARLGPVYSRMKKNIVSCGLIGIDFLQSGRQLYYLESNFNPGHYIERHSITDDYGTADG